MAPKNAIKKNSHAMPSPSTKRNTEETRFSRNDIAPRNQRNFFIVIPSLRTNSAVSKILSPITKKITPETRLSSNDKPLRIQGKLLIFNPPLRNQMISSSCVHESQSG